MSKIEELILKYCPNGVEYRKISEIAKVSIGEFVHKNNQNPNGLYPVYNGGTSNTGYYDEFNNTANKIIISARGANAGFVNKVLVDYWAGNSCYTIDVVSDELDWNFVYYFLKNSEKSLIGQQQTGSIPAVSKKQIETFKIPIPPLSVQQEIVRILDGFSELEKELEKELVARRKQYEYYRNQLVSFGEGGNHASKTMSLYEITIWDKKFNGVDKCMQDKVIKYPYLLADELVAMKQLDGDVFLLATGENVGWTTEDIAGDYLCEGEVVSIPWGKSRPVVECMKYYKGKFVTADNRIATSKDTSVLNNKYLFYWMQTHGNEIDKFYRGAGIQHPNMKSVLTMKIHIPSLAEQERIVAILDKFDALVNDISVGLPAELKARRKQYEYWRNKLLSFEEVA